MDTGMDPVMNWLRPRLIIWRLGRVLNMSEGRLPWIWFPIKSKAVRVEILKTEPGTAPDNIFSPTENKFKLVLWPRDSGILPFKKFSSATKDTRNVRFPNEGGMVPVRKLLYKPSFSSFDKDPRVLGISLLACFHRDESL